MTAVAAPQTTGGPDDYGYTWDDSVPLSWINATGGTDTGMSGFSYNQKTGPIALPFAFKYYSKSDKDSGFAIRNRGFSRFFWATRATG